MTRFRKISNHQTILVYPGLDLEHVKVIRKNVNADKDNDIFEGNYLI